MNISLVRVIVRTAARMGADATKLLAAIGLSPRLLDDPEQRVSPEIVMRLWTEAAARTGDEAFGLHAAELLQPGALDVLDYAVRSSATLGLAYGKLARFSRLLDDSAQVRVERRNGVARVTHRTAKTVRPHSDFTVGALVVLGRQMVGTAWNPASVAFVHPRPADVREYDRLFKAPLHFGSAVNDVTLQAALLDRPLVAADPGLSSVLDRYAEEMLARVPPLEKPVTERVCQFLLDALRGGEPQANVIARKLGMSPRSLQRRLGAEGTSFRGLLDATRRDLAMQYLADEHVATSEVAFLLGFSELSAFHRAFKRWTGVTPARYREEMRASARSKS